MGLTSGDVLTVKVNTYFNTFQIRDGADRGYKALREQLTKEAEEVRADERDEDDQAKFEQLNV